MIGGLTKRQKEALDFISSYCTVNGEGPSYQEIGDAIGSSSKSGVHRIVMALVERGRIKVFPKRSRSIAILQEKCPHCGAALNGS